MRMLRIRPAIAAAAACIALVPAARALEPADLAPLLEQIPSEVFSYASQGVDAEGRVYLEGVRANVPDFGIVSADRISFGDVDLAGMLIGAEPKFADLRIQGLRLSRNTYLGSTPWPFAADVLTGDISFDYALRDEQPSAIDGSLSVDFGENGRISGSVSMLEPDWYRDGMHPADRLPDIGRRLLPRQASLHVSGITIGGDALNALSDGAWPGHDVTLAVDFGYAVSDQDGGVTLSLVVTSNLAELTLSAEGAYGRLVHEEFNEDMRSGLGFGDLIEWTGARLSYKDQGLVDTLLSITMAAEGAPAMVLLAEALQDLARGTRELQADGPARAFLGTVRRVLLNYGTYAGDRVSMSVRPVAPVSFSMLGEIDVDPEQGLHPDDLFGLLRFRYSYQSR